jgi:hypothetical protein
MAGTDREIGGEFLFCLSNEQQAKTNNLVLHALPSSGSR